MADLETNIAEMKSHLDLNERIQVNVLGTYEPFGNNIPTHCILAATDKRLVFYGKKLTGYDMEVFPYDMITSFESGKSLMGSSINIFASGNRVSVKWIKDADNLKALIDYVKPRIGHKSGPTAPAAAPADDPLKVLQMRFARGEINAQQYEEMKKMLGG
jgi:hypothetical protein